MDLADNLSDFVIEEEDILNSHDVVSLFTNTSVEKALQVIEERLRSDNSWKDATCLEVEDVIELVEFNYHIFQISWTNIPSKIWHSYGRPCFTIGG